MPLAPCRVPVPRPLETLVLPLSVVCCGCFLTCSYFVCYQSPAKCLQPRKPSKHRSWSLLEHKWVLTEDNKWEISELFKLQITQKGRLL